MDKGLLSVILSFVLYLLYVLLPMIPAILIYRESRGRPLDYWFTVYSWCDVIKVEYATQNPHRRSWCTASN